jgi:tRNA1(Val) A37 N6-methylase TrmN6
VKPKDRLLDLGTGTGVMPLILADGAAAIEAVELNHAMAVLAGRNVRLNELSDKIVIREGDYRERRWLCPAESFDLVLANPPYRPVAQGQVNKLDGVARARHEFTATLADVVQSASWALKFHGRFAMVHLPERLEEIMVALQANHLAAKRLRFVQPKAGKAPNMLLIEAVKGGAAGGLKVLPPLIVHGADGRYTEEIEEIYG